MLGWLNDTLDLNYQKIEQVSNGTPLPHTHNTTHTTHRNTITINMEGDCTKILKPNARFTFCSPTFE